MSDLSLQIAASAINADQAELDNAANNLANVSTPGYAEQVVNLNPMAAASPGGVGEGVVVGSVSQDNSALDEAVNDLAQGQLGSSNETASILNLAQNAFPEPSSTGLQSQLNQLWSDLQTLATEPSSQAAAQSVIEDFQTVANTLNSASGQLSDLASQLGNDLSGQGSSTGGYVGQANQLISAIAALNGDIVAGQSASSDVNSLIDERRQDLNQLSGLLGVRTANEPDGTVTVFAGGIELVSGTNAVSLQASGTPGAADCAVETTNGVVVPPGGQIGAICNALDSTLPSYQSGLSSIADSLAQNLNNLQSAGVSASGVPGPTAASGAPPYVGPYLPSIFVDTGSATTYTPGGNSAATITVNPTLASDPSLIATASGSATAGVATIDPTTAQQMAAFGNQPGGPDDLYQSLVAIVGAQSAQASNDQSAAQSLSDSTSAQLSSVEGVSSNQETVNVLSAQQAYQAAAAVINSSSTALDALLAAI